MNIDIKAMGINLAKIGLKVIVGYVAFLILIEGLRVLRVPSPTFYSYQTLIVAGFYAIGRFVTRSVVAPLYSKIKGTA